MLSLVTFIPSFLLNHVEAVIGYGVCVLFPLPWLNAAIISGWARFGSKLTALVSGEQADIETTIETAVQGASVTAINTALAGSTGISTVVTGSTATTIVAAPAAIVATSTKTI